MIYRLIFDKEYVNRVKEKILPLAADLIRSQEAFEPTVVGKSLNEPLLLFLSDDQIRQLVPVLSEAGVAVAVLPHPDAVEWCKATGVDRNLDKAIAYLAQAPKPVKMDVLYCNGIPIFDHLIIGQSFQLTSEDPAALPAWKRWFMMARYRSMRPFRVDISLSNDQKVKTAVSGIVVSEHQDSALITRLGLEETSLNDGKMHAFLISPRSVMEMFYHAIRSTFKRKGLPPFVAHIKTAEMQLSFPRAPMEFRIDGKKYSDANLALTVDPGKLTLVPGRHWPEGRVTGESEEIYKLKPLPRGEAAQALADSPLPLIRHATSEEFKELFQVLRNNARLRNSYLVLMVLSTILATFGLFANSTPVVIGAMILAPLMAPIISLSMGTLRHDNNLITGSFMSIAAGMGLSLLFAVLITWMTPIHSPGSEILARTRPNLLDLGIAVVSGVAGAYAYAREEVAKSLAGVAIAVALIPPLAVVAIGVGWGNASIALGALLLLSTNLAGMVLAASVTFMLLGFSPVRLVTRGMLISLLCVLVLSIPLALGFKQMVDERQMKNDLEGTRVGSAVIRDVNVTSLNPVKLSIRVVSERPLNSEEIDNIKSVVENTIQRTAECEMVIAISR